MKLKNNIFPICLSIFIFVSSVLQCNILVYASEGVYPSGTSKVKKVLDEASTYLAYLASRVEAIVDGDFAKFMQNREDFIQWWNTGHISYDEKTDSVIFDEGLVNYIKQALKEYAEETNGYIIVPSVHFSTLSTSTFRTSCQYNTVKALVNEYGLVGVITYSNGGIMVRDFTEYLNGNAGFYIRQDTNPNFYIVDYEDLLAWKRIYYAAHSVDMRASCETAVHSWDEAKSSASSTEGLYYYPDSGYDARMSFYGDIELNKQKIYRSGSNLEIISKDGRNILVFKSKEALESYSVDHRTVYFGSKFYEDSGSVSGSWDDFQDWLDGKYDDYWDKLKDMIPSGSTLSEDELEKLIDKLLDQLKETTGKVEEGNQQTNSLLEKILSALERLDGTVSSSLSSAADLSAIEGYLSMILEDLDYISYKLDEMTYEEAEEKSDSFLSKLTSSFSDISNIAKTKFPLSVPWDIYNVLNLFSGNSSASAAAYEEVEAVYEEGEIVLLSAEGADLLAEPALYDARSSGSSRGGHEAPRFYIPVVLPSLNISETLVIDLSGFEVVSQISRAMLTCLFAVGLMKLTFVVVEFGKAVFS